MSDEVLFFDTHIGIEGSGQHLPMEVAWVADELDNQVVSLSEALRRFEEVIPKNGKITAEATNKLSFVKSDPPGYGMITLEIGEFKPYGDGKFLLTKGTGWKVIRYRPT